LEKAESIRRKIELGDLTLNSLTINEAVERWITDCEARQLKPQSIRKYREVKKELVQHLGGIAIRSVSVDDLRRIREGWTYTGMTTAKRLELIRAFFSFCETSGWIEKNPAKGIKSPKLKLVPTLPYSNEEWEKILWALDAYGEIHAQSPERIRRQLKALVLLMRYSGLRISDCVTLKRDRIDANGRLFLYQAKTGAPVQLPLPALVIQTLQQAEEGNLYYFWSGIGKLKTALTEWQERLKKMFVIAGIPDGHGHRLRDTFSVDLLSKGVPLQTVSLLLGHTSIRTTERHYAPYVQATQVALEAAVKLSWTA
jgi:integrase